MDLRISPPARPTPKLRLLHWVGAAGLAFAIALGSTAFASSVASRSVVVRTRDLDVGSVAGALALVRRLEQAADRVCEGSVGRQYPAARRSYAACYRSTLANAVAQFDAPLVREQYTLRSRARRFPGAAASDLEDILFARAPKPGGRVLRPDR